MLRHTGTSSSRGDKKLQQISSVNTQSVILIPYLGQFEKKKYFGKTYLHIYNLKAHVFNCLGKAVKIHFPQSSCLFNRYQTIDRGNL